ncbi:hypothetical protein PGB90_002607 [Kerria lacca]
MRIQIFYTFICKTNMLGQLDSDPESRKKCFNNILNYMATSSNLSTPTIRKYTPSFINQLQSEWNEFMLEISHSTPHENIVKTNDFSLFSKKSIAKEILIESLNKLNFTSAGNILIPVPLNTLKKVFSPSKYNAGDIFKVEFFNEIKENLNLTSLTCQRLQKLIFTDDHEISDFPSPTLPKNYRKSAPPRLLSKKKQKEINKNEFLQKNTNKNEFLKIASCFQNDTDQNLLKNIGNKNICQIIQNDDVVNKVHSPKRNHLISENIEINNNCKEKRKLLSTQKKFSRKNDKKEKKNSNIPNNIETNEIEKQYSSIYNLCLSIESDSSSLFYNFQTTKKKVKPTIVFTYFNQGELAKMYQIVKNLGFFEIENQVLSSGEENRWLFEEKFEKREFSAAVKENRLKRQKLGSAYQCDIFSKCGTMYVSKSCIQPKVEDLKELILLGSGRLEEHPDKAAHIIGFMPKHEYVKEVWILNCILQCYIIDINKYVRNK